MSQEAAFWTADRGAETDAWTQHYWDSVQAKQRDVVLQAVAEVAPIASLLEVGCHCGPNLRRLRAVYPTARLAGLDLSAAAISAGKRYCLENGVERIEFFEGAFPERTAYWPAGSVDVVLSCYALAYIAPQWLGETLSECLRLASKAVILVEPMVADVKQQQELSRGSYAEYVHHYVAHLEQMDIAGWRGRLFPLPEPIDRINGVVILERGT